MSQCVTARRCFDYVNMCGLKEPTDDIVEVCSALATLHDKWDAFSSVFPDLVELLEFLGNKLRIKTLLLRQKAK